MSVVIFQNPTAPNVCVLYPTAEALEHLTLEDIARKDVPAGCEWEIVSGDALPEDHYFFNAWRLGTIGDNKVDIDLDAAREIHKATIRAARQPLLEALDVQFQRALETGGDTADIVAQKQALRDVTKDAELLAADSPEAIKAFWPAILGPSPLQ